MKVLPCNHSKLVKCFIDPFTTPVVECGLLMERTLECGHQLDYVCPGNSSMEDVFIPCQTLVDELLPCNHLQRRLCSKPVERCTFEVNRKLACGHMAKSPCWIKEVNFLSLFWWID